jgi:hypothetical protein
LRLESAKRPRKSPESSEGREKVEVPMRDTRHNLRLDVGLNCLPILALHGRRGRQDLAQVTGLDLGDNFALGNVVKVVYDWSLSVVR